MNCTDIPRRLPGGFREQESVAAVWRLVGWLFVCLAIGVSLLSNVPPGRASENAADAEGRPPSDSPEEARLVTSDIMNFWRAYDQATPEDRVAVFRDEYLGKGSYGLRAFTRSRIGSAEKLVAAIESHPKFFASIRESTLRVSSMEKEIRASFRKLEELYPEAIFPDVYFVVGRMSSGGTTSSRGLLIGVEMHGRTEETPIEELGGWHRAVIRSPDKIPSVVAHELIHCQQQYPLWNITLLRRAIQEGSADFVAELIAGSHGNGHLHEYGNPREKELWQEFKREMYGFKAGSWLYQGDQSKDRPADLGYYVGYKICESFYGRAEDKSQAVKDILTISDFTAFLAESGYEQKFSAREE